MFERLFQLPATLARHREGPLAQAREQFLLHCAEQGMTHSSLSWLASELLMISKRLNIATDGLITQRQIEAAADQWIRFQRRRGRGGSSRSRKHFVQVASQLKARTRVPSIAKKRVSPHIIRHTTACHLLRAGVDINTIRGWLGHVSLDTTNVYAEIDLEMKAKALAKCELTPNRKPKKRWRDQPDLMEFLHSL